MSFHAVLSTFTVLILAGFLTEVNKFGDIISITDFRYRDLVQKYPMNRIADSPEA